MNSQIKTLIGGLLFFVCAGLHAQTNFTPFALEGQTFIHDPSTIIQDGTNYFIFGTGPGIRTKSSPDLIRWQMGDSVFYTPPAWTTNMISGFRESLWAPDVIRVNRKFYLYYAVSIFGRQTAAIGLATSPTAGPSASNYFWTDCGAVIASTPASAFNTIDPSALLDVDGKLW